MFEERGHLPLSSPWKFSQIPHLRLSTFLLYFHNTLPYVAMAATLWNCGFFIQSGFPKDGGLLAVLKLGLARGETQYMLSKRL